MKKTLLLTTLILIFNTKTFAGTLRTTIYCHESEPVPNEKSIFTAEIIEEKGRAANWIVVTSVNAYDVHDKTEVIKQLVEEEAGSIEKMQVVHKISAQDFTRLSIIYPYKEKDLSFLPSSLILKVDNKYVKVPMRCSHLNQVK